MRGVDEVWMRSVDEKCEGEVWIEGVDENCVWKE